MDGAGRLYFDNAATSFPKPATVYEAMDSYARTIGGSAGRSAHAQAIAGSRLLFSLREELAELMGANADLVVLTKNATEAINLVLHSLVEEKGRVAHSPLEHNAVMRPLQTLAAARGVKLHEIPGDEHGRVTAETLDAFLNKRSVDLVVLNHASNVHGLALDLTVLGEICEYYETPLIVDGAQSGGVLPINMEAMRIAALCLTGHKGLFGPTGTGALLLDDGMADRIDPLLHGGTGSVSEQETMPDFLPDRLEAGTHNTIGAAGLLAGIRYLIDRSVEAIGEHEQDLRERMIARLREIDGVEILGDVAGPATATVSILTPLAPSDLAYLLNEQYGISVRAGLHCAPRAHQTLGTMPAGAVRLAPGALTLPDAIDEVADALAEIMATVK